VFDIGLVAVIHRNAILTAKVNNSREPHTTHFNPFERMERFCPCETFRSTCQTESTSK
jgi:hypothetical protein